MSADKKTEEILVNFRHKIDAIDAQILDLIHQRLAIADAIGKEKAKLKDPSYYRPEREAQVLARLHSLNNEEKKGLLNPESLDVLFREIMSATRGVETSLSVAVLGPAGTYTEMAARRHFGSAVEIEYFAQIDQIFKAAETQKCNFAVVPVENSTEGGVNSTLDALMVTGLTICGEINLPIHHNLLSQNLKQDEITKIYAHSLSFGQCQNWLSRHFSGVEQVPVSSNAVASERAARNENSAAIAGSLAAELYKLNILSSNIEDDLGNTTRFLVLSNASITPSGNDKTSLLLSCQSRPGALVQLLQPLQDAGINMTKIESKPVQQSLWEYVFFIDIIGHQHDATIQQALEQVEQKSSLFKNLGSYPQGSI